MILVNSTSSSFSFLDFQIFSFFCSFLYFLVFLFFSVLSFFLDFYVLYIFLVLDFFLDNVLVCLDLFALGLHQMCLDYFSEGGL